MDNPLSVSYLSHMENPGEGAVNTITAATQANVTAATIRAWCRHNVIAATKVVGRWVIDATSLAHRIALGARRARKQERVSQPTGPIEIRLNATESIRARQVTSPAYKTTSWYASHYINGYEVGIASSANTAEDAIEEMRQVVHAKWERAAEAEAFENADTTFEDLTVGHTRGMRHQLNGFLPSPAAAGECHFCGLAERTCDCR